MQFLLTQVSGNLISLQILFISNLDQEIQLSDSELLLVLLWGQKLIFIKENQPKAKVSTAAPHIITLCILILNLKSTHWSVDRQKMYFDKMIVLIWQTFKFYVLYMKVNWKYLDFELLIKQKKT